MADVLTLSLRDRPIGAITSLAGDRSVFTFDPTYVEDPAAPVLGAGFKNAAGRLITEHNSTQTRLLPFFSNLLPEGVLRDYLAERAGVKPGREFFLLWAVGADLPGAVTVRTPDGEPLPPGAEPRDADGAPADLHGLAVAQEESRRWQEPERPEGLLGAADTIWPLSPEQR